MSRFWISYHNKTQKYVMSHPINQIPAWVFVSPDWSEAYLDFILSRRAIMCRQRTVEWNSITLGIVLSWMVQNRITRPAEIMAMKFKRLSMYACFFCSGMEVCAWLCGRVWLDFLLDWLSCSWYLCSSDLSRCLSRLHAGRLAKPHAKK
jgi:hypothetical protein